ncbi:MAG TPA: hypothetical protein VFE11_03170 [Dongiaceae bacterium]|jgi:hypothetical protein|nr:hypothetical protein [Dongiaceae bacterium]
MPLPSRRLLLAAFLPAWVGACAPPASYSAMVAGAPPGQAAAPVYRNAITVGSVTLGRDMGTPWTSAVSPDQVQQALVQTLAVAGLGQPANGRFRLDGMLLTLDRPYAGFAMTVTATIAWRLTDTTNGAVVYDRTFRSLGTATLDDAIDNNNRLRIADQRAVRTNLQQLVQDLSALPER